MKLLSRALLLSSTSKYIGHVGCGDVSMIKSTGWKVWESWISSIHVNADIATVLITTTLVGGQGSIPRACKGCEFPVQWETLC